MIRFSNRKPLARVAALVAVALATLFASCTEVDDKLGNDIVPPNQRFEVGFGSLAEGIESYLTYTDSISTGSLDYAYFGTMTDKFYGGVTRASALVQFAYALHSDTIHYENRESMPDSMVLVAGMKTVGGDTLKEQTFDVYRLRKLLSREDAYYSGTDYKEYVDSEPMFTFTFKGKPNGATEFDTLSLRVHNKTLAEEFMNELWNIDTALNSNDTLFVKQFNGLCITPSGTSPEDAAIYGLNLQWDTTEGPRSYLLMYGHDYKAGGDPKLVEDEILRGFVISNTTSYVPLRAVTAVEHDYSATSFGASINVNVPADEPLANPVEEGYIEGFLGVTTTLEFGDDFVESLRALRPEGSDIFINQATMYVNLGEEEYTFYDYAPARVGTYTSYQKIAAVPDYNYYYEANYDTDLLYGGYLNRTFGRYEMNLAIYLQKLLSDTEGEVSRRITLGMGAYEYMNYGIVKLSGEDEGEKKTPLVKFDITYTLIGK